MTVKIDGMDDGGIDAAEVACMRGHVECRERLKDVGWTDEQVDELESMARGYEDFARCVADEIRYRRDTDEVVNDDGGEAE